MVSDPHRHAVERASRRRRGRRDDSARTRRKILISTQRSDAREGGRDRRRADGPTRDEAPRHGLGPRRRVRPEALAVDCAQRRRLVGLARGVLVHVLSWFFETRELPVGLCVDFGGVVGAQACPRTYYSGTRTGLTTAVKDVKNTSTQPYAV